MTTVNFDFTGISAGQELSVFEPLFTKLVNSSTNTIVGGSTAGTLSWVGGSSTPTTYGYETSNVLHSFKTTYAATGLSGSMLTCCARISDYRNMLGLRFSAATTLELVILTNATPTTDSSWTVTRGANDTIEIIVEASNVIRVKFNGTYQVFPSTGTTSKTITNFAGATKVGFCARSSAVANVITAAEINYSPPLVITALNSGNPITAGQTGIAATSTGYTAVPTSITTNAAGVTASSIGGLTNDFTFSVSDRVDGGIYPKDGTSVTYNVYEGSSYASISRALNKKSTETKVIFSSPNTSDITYFAGAVFAATGRLFATDDECYYIIPAEMSDLAVGTDSGITSTNAGTFTCWVYINAGADAGKNYFYTVTVSEGGSVASVIGLTSSGLTSIGLTRVGLTYSGL